MRVLAGVIIVLIVAIQYPLWLGKGGWLRVWEIDRKLGTQGTINQRLEARNQALGAEVRDLKQGFDAIEERARYELGFIKQDEVFFQILEDPNITKAAPSGSAAPAIGR